jgi:hypothetical protein
MAAQLDPSDPRWAPPPARHLSPMHRVAAGALEAEAAATHAAAQDVRDATAVTKVAVVTGGLSGVGREVVRSLCRSSYRVLLLGRDEGAAARVCAEEPAGGASFMRCDLASVASVHDCAQVSEESGADR